MMNTRKRRKRRKKIADGFYFRHSYASEYAQQQLPIAISHRIYSVDKLTTKMHTHTHTAAAVPHVRHRIYFVNVWHTKASKKRKKPFLLRVLSSIASRFCVQRPNGFDTRNCVFKCISRGSSSGLSTWMTSCSLRWARAKTTPNVDQLLWHGSSSFNRAHFNTVRFVSIEPFSLPLSSNRISSFGVRHEKTD